MMSLETALQPSYPGPRFFVVNGQDYFEHRIDARNCVGPRLATKADKQNHPKLWASYQAKLTEELNAGLVGNAPTPQPKAKVTPKKKGK